MRILTTFAASLLSAAGLATAASWRGYNSWDNYLGAPNETDTLAIAAYMSSSLLQFGFNLLTVDEGWADSSAGVNIDAYGRYTPIVSMYPSASNGQGFKNISDQIHALGLKFGVWTIRGIPKAAADKKLPIFNSTYTADQAIRTDNPCGWSSDCYGCASRGDGTPGCNDAAVAYYKSLAVWYKEQGIDFVKLDCMFPANHAPQGSYDDDDWSMTTAFREAGLNISLSPGREVSTQNISWIVTTQLADSARVTEDFWDRWNDDYVSGLRTKLDVALNFSSFFYNANHGYPDLDMLVIGRVMSHQSHPLQNTNLTADEQQMMITLWCATGAPLIFGGRLPFEVDTNPADALAYSLITNTALLSVHNESHSRTPLYPLQPVSGNQTYAWCSTPDSSTVANPSAYISLYNGDDNVMHTITVNLNNNTGLPIPKAGQTYCATDLWTHAAIPGTFTTSFGVALRPHQAGMYLLEGC